MQVLCLILSHREGTWWKCSVSGPDADAEVAADRHEELAVGVERDRLDSLVVAGERVELLVRELEQAHSARRRGHCEQSCRVVERDPVGRLRPDVQRVQRARLLPLRASRPYCRHSNNEIGLTISYMYCTSTVVLY